MILRFLFPNAGLIGRAGGSTFVFPGSGTIQGLSGFFLHPYGGERHPGPPLPALGQLVPKQRKQNALVCRNDTQAHKTAFSLMYCPISHPPLNCSRWSDGVSWPIASIALYSRHDTETTMFGYIIGYCMCLSISLHTVVIKILESNSVYYMT